MKPSREQYIGWAEDTGDGWVRVVAFWNEVTKADE